MNEQHRQRDQRLSGEAINHELVEFLSDAGRLFCEDSRCRRTIVSSSIDKNFRATLTDVSVDGWLFGSNLGERVKAARDLEKLSSDLKPKVTAKANMSLNAKGLVSGSIQGVSRQTADPQTTKPQGQRPTGGFQVNVEASSSTATTKDTQAESTKTIIVVD
ncbi:hypothetical protein NQ314_002654 [Rhamnusium bicolor]|uniref:Uncharacterized protein n=1 Tax=Rhamnusium bicolor TaxID=1586634 RepID=A0AAV8ZPG4_9CUCU|nr:hypothetical protein NQ314_002654 [Rhamnusium bicolor]